MNFGNAFSGTRDLVGFAVGEGWDLQDKSSPPVSPERLTALQTFGCIESRGTEEPFDTL